MKIGLHTLLSLVSALSLTTATDIQNIIPTSTSATTLSTVYVSKTDPINSMVTPFYKLNFGDLSDEDNNYDSKSALTFDDEALNQEINNLPFAFRKASASNDENEDEDSSDNLSLIPIYDENDFNPDTDITFDELMQRSDVHQHLQKRGYFDLPITTTYPFLIDMSSCPSYFLRRIQLYARYFSGPHDRLVSILEKYTYKPYWIATEQPVSVNDVCNVACPPGMTPYTTLTNYHPKTTNV